MERIWVKKNIGTNNKPNDASYLLNQKKNCLEQFFLWVKKENSFNKIK